MVARGKIDGEDIGNSEVIWPDEGSHLGEPVEYLDIGADYVSCPSCRLVLSSYEYLEQAGLATNFEVENADFDPLDLYGEPEYGND